MRGAGSAIPSYVSRRGHLTPGQRRALEVLGPHYVVAPPLAGQRFDARSAFDRDGPLCVEIGSGNGTFLVAQALRRPETCHLGIELYPPGLGHTLLECTAHGLENLRLAREDAAVVLSSWLAEASVANLTALFPDPWPKKRHHKRRLLLRPDILENLSRILVPGGIFFLLTDAPDYAEEVRARLSEGCWEESPVEDALLTQARETPFALRARRAGSPLAVVTYRKTTLAGPEPRTPGMA